ncbi:hypothetical protein GCM10023143_08980 [Compostibacter hankyongensis]|uniref:Uncharacterized protein n=1 Tax=Compostibacter hankyongensis TaxID=1007089 RepID=A0ABP8FIS4_9BACT
MLEGILGKLRGIGSGVHIETVLSAQLPDGLHTVWDGGMVKTGGFSKNEDPRTARTFMGAGDPEQRNAA